MTRNADRKNGKAWKQRKRPDREGCNGKTKNGYTQAKIHARYIKRCENRSAAAAKTEAQEDVA